ncbi:MAG: DUF885 domain-containing protein [Bacteroidota bacterium]
MKTFSFTFALVLGVFLIGCSQQTEDQKFVALAENFLEQFLENNPEWATGLGDHRYDDRLGDYSSAGIQKDREFAMAYLDSLSMIDVKGLSPVNKTDYEIMESSLQSWMFQVDTLKEYEWNPRNYNPGYGIYSLIARDFAPVEERLKSIKGRLEQIPKVVAAAKENIKNPTKIHTETAISQLGGTIGMVQHEVDRLLEEVPEMKAELAPAQETAIAALKEYVEWLQTEVLPNATGDFRIGDEKYRRKLYFALESDYSKEEILKRAEADLEATQNALYETALPFFKKQYPDRTDQKTLENRKKVIKAALDKLAEDVPTNKTIVDRAKGYMKETTEFVRANNLVMVPDDPVKIIVMPEFQRGVAVAYCDSPGPLEEGGDTFYAISPTPKDWSSKRVRSFFREYNNHMLKNLTVHEAMPGHYLQLVHGNQFKAPTKIRAIFYSGTFVEGWATYAEQVMVEKGYGGPEVKMQMLKMRLRLIINSIIDQKIHTAGMTEEEAMDLMMNEGYQEEGEATGKWKRACLTSTQLSTYYVGNMELNALRKAYEAKHGGSTDMRTMHDAMLSYGSPAPKYVKAALEL